MTHNWKIHNLKYTISDKMVIRVIYECESSHENISDKKIGQLQLTTGSISDPGFINYENLTEEIVLGWVSSSIDMSSVEALNSASIAGKGNRIDVITTQEGLPWGNSF
jgi:hypothetical protein